MNFISYGCINYLYATDICIEFSLIYFSIYSRRFNNTDPIQTLINYYYIHTRLHKRFIHLCMSIVILFVINRSGSMKYIVGLSQSFDYLQLYSTPTPTVGGNNRPISLILIANPKHHYTYDTTRFSGTFRNCKKT